MGLRSAKRFFLLIAGGLIPVAGYGVGPGSPPIWTPRLAAAINPSDCDTFPGAHWLNVPLDWSQPGLGNLALFYTLNHPLDRSLPTALFIDGGPGAVVSPSRMPNENRINDAKWNLVSFHIRGAGCSQIPLDASNDVYINSLAVLRDIERIRQALSIASWDLVIGESYGSWLTQEYAAQYPESLRRIFLEGILDPPWISKPDFATASASAATQAVVAVVKKRHRMFPLLTHDQIASLGTRLAKIRQQLLAAQDSVGYQPEALVIFPQAVDKLVAPLRSLAQYDWSQFGSEFFLALQMSIYTGRRPLEARLVGEQNAIATAIVNALYPGRVDSALLASAKEWLAKGGAFESRSAKIYTTISIRVSTLLMAEALRGPTVYTFKHPAVFINGTLDGATPISGAAQVARNACAGTCVFAGVNGGGHSATNLSQACIGRFLPSLLANDLPAVARTMNHEPACRGASAIFPGHI